MPAVLEKPDVTDGDPRALYHHNLVNGESATGYSESASPPDLYGYILELLQISPSQLMHTVEGIVRSRDESLMLIAAQSRRGAVCWSGASDRTGRRASMERFNASGTG